MVSWWVGGSESGLVKKQSKLSHALFSNSNLDDNLRQFWHNLDIKK
jgi:hypothetical protein